MALFRIAHEALNNSVKHAKAAAVTITLEAAMDQLTLQVQDDGIGFDPAAPAINKAARMGMMTMAERAESIGARCTVR